MEKRYDTFFFDLDGTITDSSLGITNSVMYALKKYGIVETDRRKLYKFIGPPLTDSFPRFYGFSEEQTLEAIGYYREYYKDRGIFENRVYDGFEAVASKLKEDGKTLVVATSKPEPFARQIIEHFGLSPYFDYVAGMELDGGRGTKAEVIRYALSNCRTSERSKVLMIGDRGQRKMISTAWECCMDSEAAKNWRRLARTISRRMWKEYWNFVKISAILLTNPKDVVMIKKQNALCF